MHRAPKRATARAIDASPEQRQPRARRRRDRWSALPPPSALIGNDAAGHDPLRDTEIHRIAALTGIDPMSRPMRSQVIDELRSSFTRPLPCDVTA